MDLRQFLSVLRARWKFSVITTVIGTIATVVLVLSITPQYGSSVKLFVSTPAGGQTEYQATFAVTQRVASYADLARDPSVLQKVIDELDLDTTYQKLQQQISAEVVTSTQTINISVRAETPELAQRIAAAEADQLVALVRRLEQPSDSDQDPAITARVATDPSFSTVPVAPNVPISLAVGILASLFIGIAGALVRDLLDRTVKSRDDVEKIAGQSALGTLPFEPQIKKNPIASDSDASLAEAFRVLRTNLEYASLDESVRSILVTSALPNEGKTMVAVNLALSMVQMGKSVLVMDADMRNPNVANRLGLENSVGVVTVLLGRASLEEAVQPHTNGVVFLGTGPKAPNPAELLGTRAMRQLIKDAKEIYDVVIIDAPPMLPVADASIIVKEVDGAVLLARYGSTSREQLRLAIARIHGVGGRLLGVVLNRTPRRFDQTYGYGFGYGHGYYVADDVRKESASSRSADDRSAAPRDDARAPSAAESAAEDAAYASAAGRRGRGRGRRAIR
jgi:receptor protein-tyrosine kinase